MSFEREGWVISSWRSSAYMRLIRPVRMEPLAAERRRRTWERVRVIVCTVVEGRWVRRERRMRGSQRL